MTIGAHFTLFRAVDYGLPFEESIRSIAEQVDGVRVLVDPVNDDGTFERCAALASTYTNVEVMKQECPWDSQYPLGAWKNEARLALSQDWLIECDPLWIFPTNTASVLNSLLPDLAPNNLCVGVGSLNFFNGNNVKHSHPKVLPIVSRNNPKIIHGTPDRRGCGLKTQGGRPISHSVSVADTKFRRGGPSDLKKQSSLWIYNYEFFDVPAQYEMKALAHYLEGRGDGRYEGIDDYNEDLDGNEVDLFDVTFRLPIENYTVGIVDEMLDRTIRPISVTHPEDIREWVAAARTLKTRKLSIRSLRQRVARVIESRRRRNE